MSAPLRNHDNCGPGCFWCALQRALASRAGAEPTATEEGATAYQAPTTGEQQLRDIDQLCNFLGDMVATVPDDEGFRAVCALVSKWLSARILESRARNMQHPIWKAQHELANGGGQRA